jgi:sugar-specific transcriptional regulator TrmB
MEDTTEMLQRMGLTKYEALAYIALVSKNIDTAKQLSRDSGVPRTKMYSVLEGLAEKGWVRIVSGWPLLFKPVKPGKIMARARREYEEFLEQLEQSIEEERDVMANKFVISRRNVGLEALTEAIGRSKTIFISNATREIFDELAPHLREDAKVKVVMFPKEVPPKKDNVEVRLSSIPVVHLYDKVEVPSANILIDEERSFSMLKNPYTKRWEVDEMLYDDCISCFREYWQLGWDSGTDAPRMG